jgi:hypothetical protein
MAAFFVLFGANDGTIKETKQAYFDTVTLGGE